MTSSDSEGEGFPDLVSAYYFEDDNHEPVSFSMLPVEWNGDVNVEGREKQIFLRGITDDGLQKVFKPVTAWRFDLSPVLEPDISVFSKDNKWLKLEKPRKNYRDIIRTTLITLHCLHILKKSPDLPMKSIWDQLSKVFGSMLLDFFLFLLCVLICLAFFFWPPIANFCFVFLFFWASCRWYDIKPSQNDLIDHMQLIEEAVKRDESLGNSKFLMTLLKEKPQKIVVREDALNNRSTGFIVDDDGLYNDDSEAESNDEEEDFAVCEICDNGGNLICCDGSCLRSFHPTPSGEAAETACSTLGLSKREVDATPTFLCQNCKYKQHQCFSCGQLGCSDVNSTPEVFRCINANCGRFYHPKCVAKLLHRDAAAATELERKIAIGEKFTCPVHKCNVCEKGEDPDDPELQFAVCRRCPKSYHRKCLPRRITFEENEAEGIIQRAWTGLLPNHRILIYCLKHDIDEEIGTPVRNHIKFPEVGNKKIKHSELLSSKDVLKDRQSLGPAATGRASPKSGNEIENSRITKQDVNPGKEMDSKSLRPNSKVLKVADASRKLSSGKKSLVLKQGKSLATATSKNSIGEQLYAAYYQQSDSVKNIKGAKLVNEVGSTNKPQTASKSLSCSTQLDHESEKRILALMNEAVSSITLDDITDDHDKASTHSYSLKSFVEKTITQGKVEGSIEAVRTAMKKLDEGFTVEDAKSVCEPNVLNQLVKWKNKLKVYLAPFLFGMRYTSFGRHFTKVDKLKQIVDKIHWYVDEGDTIVDFCCGANDFSWLMKEKLDGTGKKCFYRNFDLFRPKNDFNFEKRDWMSVRQGELPPGSQLIMGLNPPFGVKASLANKFINKALEFKPKLVVLIVPPVTERLDKKKLPYDLVWEDKEKLSGRSFYLPGSVDVNEKKVDDWNVVAPLLYLWSRPDWTVKHKAIAEEHGHLDGKQVELQRRSNSPEESHTASPAAAIQDKDGDVAMGIDDDPPQNNAPKEPNGKSTNESEIINAEAIPAGTRSMEALPRDSGSKKEPKKNQSAQKQARARAESDRNQPHKRLASVDPYHGRPRHSPSADLLDVRTSKGFSRVKDTAATGGNGDYSGSQPSFSGSASQYEVEHRGPPSGFERVGSSNHVGEVSRRYSFEMQDPYAAHGARQYLYTDNGGVHDPYTNSRTMHLYTNSRAMHDLYTNNVPMQDPYTNNAPRWRSVGAVEPDYGSGSYTREVDSFNFRPCPSEMDPSYNYSRGMLAMQRYAPRLDELNHVRMGNVGPEFSGGNGIGMHEPPRPWSGGRGAALGFAPGPHSLPHQNSSGWIHE